MRTAAASIIVFSVLVLTPVAVENGGPSNSTPAQASSYSREEHLPKLQGPQLVREPITFDDIYWEPPTPTPPKLAPPPPPQARAAATVEARPVTGDIATWLVLAGWPAHLHAQAASVAHCESGHNPFAKNGVMLGLMQLSDRQAGWQGWWEYFGFDPANYADPVYNLELAYKVYLYDIDRGYAPWSQWQCKP